MYSRFNYPDLFYVTSALIAYTFVNSAQSIEPLQLKYQCLHMSIDYNYILVCLLVMCPQLQDDLMLMG